MKDRKTKEKKHESTIGKIIYGFLLFMPLMAIAVTSLVSTFNMSAKEETEITYKYQTNEINTNQDLIVGNTYYLSYEFAIINESNFYELFYNGDTGYNIFFINKIVTDYGYTDFAINTYYIDYAELYYEVDSTQYAIFNYDDDNDNASIISRNSNVPFKLGFILTYLSNEDTVRQDLIDLGIFNSLPIELNEVQSLETHNLEPQDVFYRAIDKVQQSPLFNWAQNSIIYTGMSNFTTSLSITTPFIPLLMTYWLIISVVYFLYDIVLIILVVLHRKIHYLEESI